MELIDLARRLVEIPSVTGQEQEVAAFVESHLRGLGWDVDSQPVGDQGRRNLLARVGPPSVLLCTHLDTVPPVLPVRLQDGVLHGRGACDAKGILASMVHAAQGLRRAGEERVGLLFLVGEEVDNAGAIAADGLHHGARAVILGEPTENRLAAGHKGGLKVGLQARGVAAHSAYPERGLSAVEPLLDVLEACRRVDWGRDPALGSATLNIGQLRAGVAANVLAPEAEAVLFLRTVGPAADARRRLEECLQAGRGRVEAREVLSYEPMRFRTFPGEPAVVVGFGTDGPFLTRIPHRLLVGPGSIHVAHSREEHVRAADLLQAERIYRRLAERLLAEEEPPPGGPS